MNNFNIVAKNTLFLTVSEIFLKSIGFFWVVFLAHSLSVDHYGRYSFVNSFIAIFSFLPDLGVGLIVIREIAKKREKAHIYLGNSFILNGFLALLTFLLILLTLLVSDYPSQTRMLIIIASITLFISTLRSVGIFFFDGIEKMQYSALLNSLNTLLIISFAVLSVILGFGLTGIFLGMLLGTIISLITTWTILIKKFVLPKFSLDFFLIKHLLWEGLPLGLAAFSSLIYTKIDTIILAHFLGERSVGIYNAATPFVFSLIQLLNVPFAIAVYPAFSRLEKEDNGRFMKALKKSLVFVASWSFPLAFLVSFLSPLIIPIVFGAKYDNAIPVLSILIFFVPFASLSAILYKVLIILNKQKIYLFISIAGAVINVILNFILIPKFFIFGAAYASVSTQLILFIIYISVVRKYL